MMKTKTYLGLALMALGCVAITATTVSAQNFQTSPIQTKQMGIRSSFVPMDQYEGRQHFGGQHSGGNQLMIRPGTKFGERINYVQYGSPAYRAGLEVGDIIVGYYGNYQRSIRYYDIGNSSSLRHAIQMSGSSLRLKVRNVRNGQYVFVTVYFYGGYDNQGGGRPHFQPDHHHGLDRVKFKDKTDQIIDTFGGHRSFDRDRIQRKVEKKVEQFSGRR